MRKHSSIHQSPVSRLYNSPLIVPDPGDRSIPLLGSSPRSDEDLLRDENMLETRLHSSVRPYLVIVALWVRDAPSQNWRFIGVVVDVVIPQRLCGMNTRVTSPRFAQRLLSRFWLQKDVWSLIENFDATMRHMIEFTGWLGFPIWFSVQHNDLTNLIGARVKGVEWRRIARKSAMHSPDVN